MAVSMARQRDAGLRAWHRIRVHAQDIPVTGEALLPATGGHQMAGAKVTPAVKTFAAHQARPVDVQARVEVEAKVGVQTRAQVAVEVQVEVEVEVEVQM